MMGRSWRVLGDQLIDHYSAVLGRPWQARLLDLPARPWTGHAAGPGVRLGAGVPR
jgi:hypothetical protein